MHTDFVKWPTFDPSRTADSILAQLGQPGEGGHATVHGAVGVYQGGHNVTGKRAPFLLPLPRA